MGREKKGGPGVASGSYAKERHKKDRKNKVIDRLAPPPPGLVARPERPQFSSKHKTYFEIMENKNKKKKLEFEFTTDRRPPPGFEFVTIGNPALTTACKELSRERDAMIFIVTTTNGRVAGGLSFHVNRIGHHIRASIFEEAKRSVGASQDAFPHMHPDPDVPEPIPESQEDINKQADAAIRDLFPRIPNTDRQMVIQHAFNKSKKNDAEPPVGLAPTITLSRRVQLAVLAHIRHTHTRYDQLLRETTYANARKVVEPLCLDILVKWRGDEETGRDQLDEILCEVIVISDSESDEEDGETDSDEEPSDPSSDEVIGQAEQPAPLRGGDKPKSPTAAYRRGDSRPRAAQAGRRAKLARKDRRAAKRAQRGFSRYQAALDRAWHEAVERQRVGGPETVRAMPLNQHPDQEPLHSRAITLDYGQPSQPQVRDAHAQREPPPHQVHYSHENVRPIVGPRPVQPVLYTDALGESVRPSNQDPKDFPILSIEPYSPRADQFPAQFQDLPYRTRERDPFPEFIRLPPRHETGRMPAAPPRHYSSAIPVSLQPLNQANSSVIRNNSPLLRSEARPIWIEDDEAPMVRSPGRPDDYVDFVRVSNKFPRRHEAPVVEPERHAMQPRAHPQDQRQMDAFGRSEVHFTPVEHQRAERVVAKVEMPDYQAAPGFSHIRQFDPAGGHGGGSGFQRVERVVGIEYLPVSHR
ncbi:hypothetical protein QBC47DRAFT_26117 [Echria macrotheca]|uniref:DUF2293 domain-containing protein n=1 Tax=Echria macrotheca TaxID=438768 RepID=A0AAJ0BNT5_9PEZI|nr:hypothetical protein QBC47DRAFT_26117 [Echria macrotheca]